MCVYYLLQVVASMEDEEGDYDMEMAALMEGHEAQAYSTDEATNNQTQDTSQDVSYDYLMEDNEGNVNDCWTAESTSTSGRVEDRAAAGASGASPEAEDAIWADTINP